MFACGGDDGRTCGSGTMEVDGECVAMPTECGAGTVLDMGTNSCVVDQSTCQGGTVLIGGKCVDPTAGLTVDLTESAEPNDAQGAGDITLKAEGQTFVVQGVINPYTDSDSDGHNDVDYDPYVVSVTGPTLVHISVDGTNGLMGAYIAINTDQNSTWTRYGMNLSGDTSERDIYFPQAGTYAILVGDTRSMYIASDSPPAAGAGGAAGNPNATYYMSLTVKPIPAPTALTLTAGANTTMGSLDVQDVKFYSAPMGLGLNDISVSMPGSQANGALVVAQGTIFRKDAVESVDPFSGTEVPADTALAGFTTGASTATIVVDATYNYGPGPSAYTLAITTGDAAALSTTGGTASQPTSDTEFSVFYYDVAARDDIDGFDLSFDVDVAGVLVNQDLQIVANFTYDPTAGFSDLTFTDYQGLIRHPAAGRYYFLVFDANATGATNIAATSTITKLTPGTITTGTALANQPINPAFGSAPFTYDAGTNGWLTFTTSGANTSTLQNGFYDPTTAYGALDALQPSGGLDTPVPDATPIFGQTYPQAGATHGRIILDDGTTKFLVVTHATAPTTGAAVSHTFAARSYYDFGAVANGNTANKAGETFDATTTTRYYLVKGTAGDEVDLGSTPVTNTLNTQIQTFDANENVTRTANNGGVNQQDTLRLIQSTSPTWTAFAVSKVAGPATATFDVSVGDTTFAPGTYAQGAGTTLYANACTGGTTQTLVDDGSGYGGSDEGLTARINAPAGFAFFGLVEPSFVVSSNGWLSFGSPTAAAFSNKDMPTAAAPNGVVAPYWDDLENVTVCTKTSGTKLIIQWTGDLLSNSQAVQFQAILDGANSTVEFVYGLGHVPTGTSATIGIEDQAGGTASKLGFNTANTVTAASAKKFTPN